MIFSHRKSQKIGRKFLKSTYLDRRSEERQTLRYHQTFTYKKEQHSYFWAWTQMSVWLAFSRAAHSGHLLDQLTKQSRTLETNNTNIVFSHCDDNTSKLNSLISPLYVTIKNRDISFHVKKFYWRFFESIQDNQNQLQLCDDDSILKVMSWRRCVHHVWGSRGSRKCPHPRC